VEEDLDLVEERVLIGLEVATPPPSLLLSLLLILLLLLLLLPRKEKPLIKEKDE
jgi:hypothetical protein